MRPSSRNSSGFTLVEVVIIAPVVILVIGAIVTAVVSMTGSAMRMQARAQLQRDVLAALDMMEQDLYLSVNIAPIHSNRLDMDVLATDVNPMDRNRRLIRRSNCQPVSDIYRVSDAVNYRRSYFITGGNLYRSLALTAGGCQDAAKTETVTWQRPGTGNDETLIRGALEVTMAITYDRASAQPTQAAAASVALTAKRRVAGRDIAYTGYLYARSANILP